MTVRPALVTLLAVVVTVGGCTSADPAGPTESPVTATPVTTVPVTVTTTSPPPEATTTEATTTTEITSRPIVPIEELTIEAFPVPAGSRPHDVAPAPDGTVWYTAQGSGELGRLDPQTGDTVHIPLGPGSRPHGVIVGPDDAPWITDSGLNAIVRVDPDNDDVDVHALPADRPGVNLNTATFDGEGVLWFTGQGGVYGWLDPITGDMEVHDAPGGTGPYGITTTPKGDVYYASLAGSHIAAIDANGEARVLDPPTPNQGARRVWSDSEGAIWVSEWNSGQVSRYHPAGDAWTAWSLPGDEPAAYAVYVDESDAVWLSDFGANALVRFDPTTETFDVLPLPHDPGDVRQILGRPGEVWGAESAADHLVVVRAPRGAR